MSRNDEFSRAIDQLPEGAHFHLDEVLEGAPRPGSRAWLPILRELARDLASRGGFWTLSLPVGEAALRTPLPDPDGVFDSVSEPERSAQPAVHRLGPTLQGHTWNGQHYVARHMVSDGLWEVVSFARQDGAPPDEPGFRVDIVEEIRAKP